MSRAVLLGAVFIAAASAAPAPFLQPGGTPIWGRTIDPRGDCRFLFRGEALAISIPGKGHDLGSGLHAPRLLREVEGDFVAEVRVGGDFRDREAKDNGVVRAAGLYVADGAGFVCLERVAGLATPPLAVGIGDTGRDRNALIAGRKGMSFEGGPPLSRPAYLRIKRRRGELFFASSLDGKAWSPLKNGTNLRLGDKVQVGVVAEVARGEAFTAEFRRFKLTKLAPPAPAGRFREIAR